MLNSTMVLSSTHTIAQFLVRLQSHKNSKMTVTVTVTRVMVDQLSNGKLLVLKIQLTNSTMMHNCTSAQALLHGF